MKKIFILLLTSLTFELTGQNKHTIFHDSVGQVTTFENHWAQVITGKFKSHYHKVENKKTLVRTTKEEFELEVRNTEKRIRIKDKGDTDFPEFNMMDTDGDSIAKSSLMIKILVINFWFIGAHLVKWNGQP
jgi:hypothetical protein